MSSSQSGDEPLFTPVGHVGGGVTFAGTNVLIDKWIQCWDHKHPLLDIGCGNCNNSNKALDSGAHVFATEMNTQTLITLKKEYSSKPNISFYPLKLPGSVPFDDASFSGILCSEVFHFLNHVELIASAWELHRLLISGGKIILTCCSEDENSFSSDFLRTMRRKQRQHRPAYFETIGNIIEHEREMLSTRPFNSAAMALHEIHKQTLPDSYFTIFNVDQLAMLFERMGFHIESLSSGPAPQYPTWIKGEHDQVRLVAVKK